jgi:predicted TPR repeat methyltransferase/Flp pilus assembly protein TadD
MSATEPAHPILKLAEKEREANRLGEAAHHYREYLLASPADADATCWLGYCLWKMGDLKGGIAHYEQGAKLAPSWGGIHNCLGLIHRQRGDDEAAQREFRMAIKLSPRMGEAHANLGELLWDRGRSTEATDHLRKAVEYEPEDAEMYSSLGELLTEQDCFVEATLVLREAIRLDPDLLPAHTNLARALSLRDMHDEAEAALTIAFDLSPNDASLWSRLGSLRWMAKRYDDAKKAAEAALSRDPKLPYPWFLLGEIAARNGDTGTALKHYQHYLTVDPDDTEGVALKLAHLGLDAVPDKAPEQYMQQLYAKRANYWDETMDEAEPYRGPIMVAQALESVLGLASGLDILDAGCGTGLCGPRLRPRARRLDGVDLSVHMIEKARERNMYDELIIGDLETTMLARPRQYDVVASAATLIHFGDLAGPLRAAATALRPGGWMAFTAFPHRGEGVAMLPFSCHAHSEGHIRERADAAGFDVVSIAEDIHEHQEGKPVTGLIVLLQRR